jgi:hypothetical protein
MGLDIRYPIGFMFALVGGILAIKGLLSTPEDYKVALGININLYWGLFLVVFGSLMLGFAWRDAGKEKAAAAKKDGKSGGCCGPNCK